MPPVSPLSDFHDGILLFKILTLLILPGNGVKVRGGVFARLRFDHSRLGWGEGEEEYLV